MEQVQSNEGLGKKLIPKAQGKRGIIAAEGCNEMIFPSATGTFSSITAMGSRGCELKSYYVVRHELLEQVRGFIVYLFELWIKYTGSEASMDDFVDACNFWDASTLYGFDKGGVAVIIKKN